MARDIKALELLRKELSKLKELPDPPKDLAEIETYEKKWGQQIDGTQKLSGDIAEYSKAIHEHMEKIREFLNKTTEQVQQRILDIIDSIQWTDKPPKGVTTNPLQLINRLQQMEKKKNRLEESLLQTQALLDKIDQMKLLTFDDIDNLRGCIKNWMQVRDESYAEEKRKREAAERERREREERERKRREEEERRRREEEEERKRQEEERRRKEEEDRKRREEERRIQEEEERRRREEEERLRKEEEERQKREEEDRKKQEELRLAEEERRRKEEERRRKEEERKRREEERRREIERRRREEEDRKKRLDPNNWDAIRYKRSNDEVDGARAGLCCVVSAVPGALKEDDLECLASDEVRPEDVNVALGDKPASSIIHVTSKTGQKDLEAPMRVFVPFTPVDSEEEITIKCSVDGQDWEEKEPIYQPSLMKDLKNQSLVATEVNQFENVKVMVVARTKSEDIIVDKPGLAHQSNIDKKVKFVFPRDTFQRPTRVKLQIRQIQPDHLNLATQQYETCENILSTSPLVTITCDEGTAMDVDIDITRTQTTETRLEKGRYHHVFRGKDKQWHFADSGIKNKNQDVTITLPRGKEHYSVIEIETRKEVQKDTVMLAAEEIFKHAHKSVVRLIARQKIDDQSILMLQCLRRDQIASRLAELDTLGYSIGPDTSREFCLSDGQKLLVKCKGNIDMTTRSKKNVIS